jgi:hypothetical protein
VPEVLPRLGLTLPGVFLQGLLITDAQGNVLHSRCAKKRDVFLHKEYKQLRCLVWRCVFHLRFGRCCFGNVLLGKLAVSAT